MTEPTVELVAKTAMDWVPWLSLGVSGVAILLSTGSVIIAWRALDLQRRKMTADQLAAIDVQVNRDRAGHMWHISLRNNGKTQAREVSVQLDGVPIDDHPVLRSPGQRNDVETLEPASLYTYTLMPSMDGPGLPKEMRVCWTDVTGVRHETTTSITA